MARILIIDDEELIRMTLCQTLERDGHTVTQAPDGEQGVAMFRESKPDLVITDILMPNKEGIETIMALRRIDPGVKIIAMSGGGRMQNTSFLDLAKQLGADAVLKKPFQNELLSRTVADCLGSSATG